MIRTIIALNDEAQAQSMTQALVHRGITVRYRCQSGAEVLRAVKEMGGGVIICSFKLRDMTAKELADRLTGQALILVLAKGNTLALCDHDDLFTLAVPVRPSELIGAVNMLLQMDAMRAAQHIPKRSTSAQETINKAKKLLMRRHNMTEPEAHHYLQQHSMRAGVRMEDIAHDLLNSNTSNE